MNPNSDTHPLAEPSQVITGLPELKSGYRFNKEAIRRFTVKIFADGKVTSRVFVAGNRKCYNLADLRAILLQLNSDLMAKYQGRTMRLVALPRHCFNLIVED